MTRGEPRWPRQRRSRDERPPGDPAGRRPDRRGAARPSIVAVWATVARLSSCLGAARDGRPLSVPYDSLIGAELPASRRRTTNAARTHFRDTWGRPHGAQRAPTAGPRLDPLT